MTGSISLSTCSGSPAPLRGPDANRGFSLVEFMLSTLILLVIAGSVFSLMSQTQRTASYQSEIQTVLENTRIAMETIERIVQQAGNDPLNTGIVGVTIVSATEVNIRSDLTGAAPGQPDKGDPDGDIGDPGENVTIRYNAGNRTIDLVSGGVTQPLAGNISAFNLQYFDQTGAATGTGANVRKVRVSLTGASRLPDPQTRKTFGLRLNSDIQIATRQ